jgi:hypothetical protein
MNKTTDHRSSPSKPAVTVTLHHPVLADVTRLHLVSLLDIDQWCRFAYLRETLGLTDDRLKRHFQLLRSRDYIDTIRGIGGTGWARLTTLGAEHRDHQFAALQELRSVARAHAAATQTIQPDWFVPVITP